MEPQMQTRAARAKSRAHVAFDSLENMPELLGRIFSHLDTDADLARACIVKRSWLASAGADDLWRARCEQSFPLASALKLRAGSKLSYRQLFAQRKATKAVPVEAQALSVKPKRGNYMLGVEIRKLGDAAGTGGEILFSDLVELDKRPRRASTGGGRPRPPTPKDNTLAASITNGSTGVMLRAGDPVDRQGVSVDFGAKTMLEWDCAGLDLEFHVDCFIVRKSDGKTISLCAGTSREEADYDEEEMDSLARRPDPEMRGASRQSIGKSTEYCWLVPGTGKQAQNDEVSVLAARLVAKIEYGRWKSEEEFHDSAKLLGPVPDFDNEEAEYEWRAEREFWECSVNSVSISMRPELFDYYEYDYRTEERCSTVSGLLRVLESPALRHRWV
jgi:hypothetical protein